MLISEGLGGVGSAVAEQKNCSKGPMNIWTQWKVIFLTVKIFAVQCYSLGLLAALLFTVHFLMPPFQRFSKQSKVCHS